MPRSHSLHRNPLGSAPSHKALSVAARRVPRFQPIPARRPRGAHCATACSSKPSELASAARSCSPSAASLAHLCSSPFQTAKPRCGHLREIG